MGTGPAQIDTAPGSESSCPLGDYLCDRLSGLPVVCRGRSAPGDTHQRALRTDIGVPDIGIAQRLLEVRTRHTVDLLGLAAMSPNDLWCVDVVHAPVQLGMQRLDVIRLAEPVGDRLPIRIDLDGHGCVATEGAEPTPGAVVWQG